MDRRKVVHLQGKVTLHDYHDLMTVAQRRGLTRDGQPNVSEALRVVLRAGLDAVERGEAVGHDQE